MEEITRTGLVVAGLAALVAAVTWFALFGASIGAVSSIDSNSMSHAPEEQAGVLDPGEWRRLDPIDDRDDVQTFYEAKTSGHTVGGDHGDVLAYRPEGVSSSSPTPRILPWPGEDRLAIEHRPIAWVVYNETADAYDVPLLGVEGDRTFTLPAVGVYDPQDDAYVHEDVAVTLDPRTAGRHDGFLTKGDFNPKADQDRATRLDEAGHVQLVTPDRVDGKVADHVDSHAILQLQIGVPIAAALVAAGTYVWRRGHVDPPLPIAGTDRCGACGDPVDETTPFCPSCGEHVGEER